MVHSFYYILIGTIILALASITDLIYSLTPEGNFHFSWHTPPTYYGIYSFNILQLGIIAELTLFSLAIGQKTNEVYLDRDRSHKSLIFQLKENQKLQNKFTQELQSEIEKKSSQIILEKEKTIKTQFENQILQLESEMLQTQRNPHFIFNSLNSIKYFAMTKSKSETSAYISDFSKLMRMILQNSRRKLTSLREELEFLQLYLEIESKRYQGKFDYEFIVDKKINAQSLFIPPMLIQPIIENSMVHGLLPKTEKGMVSINFMVNEQVLKIVIEDNGIGRKASALLQRERKINTKSSLATKITNERIKVINELYQIKAEMTILDLNSEDGSSLGTRVIVDLPAILESNFD